MRTIDDNRRPRASNVKHVRDGVLDFVQLQRLTDARDALGAINNNFAVEPP